MPAQSTRRWLRLLVTSSAMCSVSITPTMAAHCCGGGLAVSALPAIRHHALRVITPPYVRCGTGPVWYSSPAPTTWHSGPTCCGPTVVTSVDFWCDGCTSSCANCGSATCDGCLGEVVGEVVSGGCAHCQVSEGVASEATVMDGVVVEDTLSHEHSTMDEVPAAPAVEEAIGDAPRLHESESPTVAPTPSTDKSAVQPATGEAADAPLTEPKSNASEESDLFDDNSGDSVAPAEEMPSGGAADVPPLPEPAAPAPDNSSPDAGDGDELFDDADSTDAGSPAEPSTDSAAPGTNDTLPAGTETPLPAGEESPTADGDLNPFGRISTPARWYVVSATPGKAGQAPAMRAWTDNTGRFRTEGRLVGVTNGYVRLLKANQRYSTVPVQRLSSSDLDYVRLHISHLVAADGKSDGQQPVVRVTSSQSVQR